MDDKQSEEHILRHLDLMNKTNAMFYEAKMDIYDVLHFLSVRMMSLAKSNDIDIKALKDIFQKILQEYDEMPLTGEQAETEIMEKIEGDEDET